MAMSFLAPLFDLAQDEVVKEKAVEAAKQFFSGSTTMAMSFLAPLFDLAQDEVVKEKAVEAAKQFFANSNITINLLPALIAGALLLLLGLPLLALLFQPAADTSATGYGPPAEEYGAPSSSYGSAYSRSDEGYEEYR